MTGMLQRLRDLVAGLRGRALAVVAVLAIGAALGVGVASAPAPIENPRPREAVARGVHGMPVDAGFHRPELDVDEFVAHETRIAEERRRRAQEMLDRIYPGLAFVTVSVELDPRWERTSEKVQPDQPAIIEDDRPEGGESGMRRRVLEPFAGTRESGMLAPEVRSVSVAVVLDESVAIDSVRRNSIVAAVAKAAGLVVGRDPDVELLIDRFPRTPSSAIETRASGILDSGLAGWAAFIALAALGLAWLGLRRGGRSSPVAPVASPATSAAAEPVRADLRREIEDAIHEDPVVVSRLVEGWLTEGRA